MFYHYCDSNHDWYRAYISNAEKKRRLMNLIIERVNTLFSLNTKQANFYEIFNRDLTDKVYHIYFVDQSFIETLTSRIFPAAYTYIYNRALHINRFQTINPDFAFATRAPSSTTPRRLGAWSRSVDSAAQEGPLISIIITSPYVFGHVFTTVSRAVDAYWWRIYISDVARELRKV